MAGPTDDAFDAEFVVGLHELTMPELRHRRGVADEVETGRSFLRRLVQGRLDIVLAERHRRDAGEVAGDTADLVDRLPAILGDHVHAPGLGRLPSLMAPGDIDPALQRRLDSILATHTLANLPDVNDAELAGILEGLTLFERDISHQRRYLHDVLDRLQEEMVRRYRDHEASVDDLLRAARDDRSGVPAAADHPTPGAPAGPGPAPSAGS